MGISTAMRTAAARGRRALSLAMVRPRMVRPLAAYPPTSPARIVILGKGRNASVDLYLRPRAERTGLPVRYADIDDDPATAFGEGGPAFVIICRYITTAWAKALRAAGSGIVRCAFFMDDDLPAMISDAALPAGPRSKVADLFGRHVGALDDLCGEVWVSTAEIARRYDHSRPAVLAPTPDFDPPSPSGPDEQLVVYHATDVHHAERQFVLDIARLLHGRGSPARFEITGDAALIRRAAGLPNVTVTPQTPWPRYRLEQADRAAALSLAPLFESPVNQARAPVKAFDAARLGAAGLYADAPPYRDFVRAGGDGVLLAMDAEVWAAAIEDLLSNPVKRRALAAAAAFRLRMLRRAPNAFPPPPRA